MPFLTISIVWSLILSPPATIPPAVDTARLEAVEELTESLANDLQGLSDAIRRRDIEPLGRALDEQLRVESFPSLAGPLTHDIKWVDNHVWSDRPPAPDQQTAASMTRVEFLQRLSQFLEHFSSIDDFRFEIRQARFDDKPVVTGEADLVFRLVGRDTDGRREWVKGTAFVSVAGGVKQPWRITRWRTGSIVSDVAPTDLFTEISGPAGIALTIPAFGVPPNDGFISHGGAAADLNDDGLIDLIFSEYDGIRLFLNDGKGVFKDASTETLIDLAPAATSILPLDFDNDGDTDLFLANVGKQHLLENKLHPSGTLAFQDISDEAGVEISAIGFSAAAGDVNGDGLPDIFVTAYNRYGTMMPDAWSHATNGTPDLLFVNQGNGRFREMAHEWGVDDGRWGLAAGFADVDGDGRLDLFVANDFGEAGLFMNLGGRFEDQAAARGVQGPGMGMGVSFGDPDNDGDLDLHVTNMSSYAGQRVLGRLAPRAIADEAILKKLVNGNTLFENLGDGHFRDMTEKAGGLEAGWAWGGGFIDIDNDGWEDEYSVNGFISGRSMNDTSSFFWRHAVAAAANVEKPGNKTYQKTHMGRIYRGGMSFSGYERDGLFLNLEKGRFRDISGISGIDSITDGRGAIFADRSRSRSRWR